MCPYTIYENLSVFFNVPSIYIYMYSAITVMRCFHELLKLHEYLLENNRKGSSLVERPNQR